MATYHTIKCPHCKSVVEYSIGKPQHIGSPFRICQQCGKEYIDTNYKEAALLSKKDFVLSVSWIGILLYGGVSLITMIASITLIFNYGFDFMFLLALLFGIVLAYRPIKQLITLIGYVSFKDEKFQRELEASKKRLSDPKYVIALWQAGAYVTHELLDWAQNAIDNDITNEVAPIADNDVQYAKHHKGTRQYQKPICIDSLFDISDDYIGKYVQLIGTYSWTLIKKDPLLANIWQFSGRRDINVTAELLTPLPDYVMNDSSHCKLRVVLRGVLQKPTGSNQNPLISLINPNYVLKDAEYIDYWRNENGELGCTKDACQYACSMDCPIHLNVLGKEKCDVNEWFIAIAFLKRSVFIAPDYADAWRNLGYAYMNLQQYNDAYEAFSESDTYLPNNERTIYGKIVSLTNIGRYKDAENILERYQRLFPVYNSSNLSNMISERMSKTKEISRISDEEYFEIYIEKGFDELWKMIIEEKESSFATTECTYTGSSYSKRCARLEWFASVSVGSNGEKIKSYREALLRDGVEGAEEMLMFDVIDAYERKYIRY